MVHYRILQTGSDNVGLSSYFSLKSVEELIFFFFFDVCLELLVLHCLSVQVLVNIHKMAHVSFVLLGLYKVKAFKRKTIICRHDVSARRNVQGKIFLVFIGNMVTFFFQAKM